MRLTNDYGDLTALGYVVGFAVLLGAYLVSTVIVAGLAHVFE